MRLVKRHYIELQPEDRKTLLENALDIDQGISRSEFVEYIESMLGSVVLMVENEFIEK